MNTDAGPSVEKLESTLDLTYTWGYQDTRAELRNLYTKATRSQWLPDAVIPWNTDVDCEKPMTPEELFPLYGSDIYRRLTEAERRRLNVEMTAWMVSQFLHGEQGALLATSQLVIAVDSLDSKLYGGSQVVDEARHVDVYNRYLHEKVGVVYGISPHLRKLLDMILLDSRWDMKFLGMQIMIEGLALAAFGMIRQTSYEPLLKEITRYVMADEARHVAYGVMSLRDFYAQQNEREIRERQDFVYEAAVMMRDRFLFQEVWEKCNMPAAECAQIALHNQGQIMFRQLLFAKIVPAIKRIGLLSDALRGRFQQLGILQYENWADPFADLERAERETPPSAPPLAVPT